MKTKFKSIIRVACHSFGGAICAEAAMLISFSDKTFVEMPNGQIGAFNIRWVDSVLTWHASLNPNFDTPALRWRVWQHEPRVSLRLS